MELDRTEFEALRDLVYQRTGLMFEERKIDFVRVRVIRRAHALDCRTVRDYVYRLRFSDQDGTEFQQLIESMTTNETYFFRDFPQLECFANQALPLLTECKRTRDDYSLNMWSAACSTGDEPYTLAIILRACLDDFARWRIRLLASDIDTRVLAQAREGRYTPRAVQDVPSAYLDRFFLRNGDTYHVSEPVRRMVDFVHLNLIDPPAMERQRGFDIIFCRNVLIYFDDRSRQVVLDQFYRALLPGGFLFLGHSESVGRISGAYEAITLGDTVVYRKPLLTQAVPSVQPVRR